MGKKIAIFDFTDCEGCEIELLGLKDLLLEILNNHQLVNFRLSSEFSEQGPFDISIVEGVITNKRDIKKIKAIRQQSKILVALGACAVLGGVQSMINQQQAREKAGVKIYNNLYKLGAPQIKPLKAYVKVDYNIRGCPANPKEIKETLVYLLKGKIPPEKKESVCAQCPRGPFGSSHCLIKQKKPCLGLFTYAGCEAICLKNGLYCWGCWGIKEGIKLETIKKTLSFLPEKEVEKLVEVFNKARV